MSVLEYDDEATKRLLALYVTPDVVAQRREFISALGFRSGERVLDVGSGPGFLATEIAEQIGDSGRVCGIDISESLLEVARSSNHSKHKIEFRYGDATQLPYPDEAFDVVVSTQVLEYVSEVDSALAEIYRVLRPGGRVGLLDTDWDSIVWHSQDRLGMNRILTAWEDHAADPFLPRTLAKRLNSAGFQIEDQRIMPLSNTEYDQNTYSNRIIDLIVSFVVGRGGITQVDADLWSRNLRDCGQNGDYFFSLNRYLFLAVK